MTDAADGDTHRLHADHTTCQITVQKNAAFLSDPGSEVDVHRLQLKTLTVI